MPKKLNFELEPIDYVTLREQKRSLLECTDQFPILHGLVHLIDAIQDQAVDSGIPEENVFGRD